MHCTHCGAVNPDEARACSSCQQPLHSVWEAPSSELVPAIQEVSYANFWERLAALILDSLLVGVGAAAVFGVLSAGLAAADAFDIPSGPLSFAPTLLVWLFPAAYFILMESGEHGATLGKRALKLRVVDGDGQRIGRGRALGRLLGRLLSSGVLYIGYLIQPFTERKQALHDMLAGTLVVRTEKTTNGPAIAIIVVTAVLILAMLAVAGWLLLGLLRGGFHG